MPSRAGLVVAARDWLHSAAIVVIAAAGMLLDDRQILIS
jgi:hypothetical protein